jgi:hypothetical protein
MRKRERQDLSVKRNALVWRASWLKCGEDGDISADEARSRAREVKERGSRSLARRPHAFPVDVGAGALVVGV